MSLKLIATDLDGTFLSDDRLPSTLNVAAVRLAYERGVFIVFATGRPARWLQALDLLADINPDVLASNGAVTYDIAKRQVLRASPLPFQPSLEAIADVVAAVPGTTFAVEYETGWGRLHAYPPRGDFVEADVITDSPAELLGAGVPVKLLILQPDMSTEKLAQLVTPVVAGRLDITYSWAANRGLIEASAPGVSKGSALLELMAALGVGRDEVAAFGDMPNDIPMLEVAGRPFAMTNAHPLVLQRGYPTAGNNFDDGFGKTVMTLLSRPADSLD